MEIRREPCSTCPYRRDVPSGVWATEEYLKLPEYDAETFAQPVAAFRCHVSPDHGCCGWAVVHSSRGHEYELLALRFAGINEIPEPKTPLFSSGLEAAEHGLADIDHPSVEAFKAIAKVVNKAAHLRTVQP